MTTIEVFDDIDHLDEGFALEPVGERSCAHWSPPNGRPARSDAVPLPKCAPPPRRALKHPRLMHYNRLVIGVIACNLALLAYGVTIGSWWTSEGINIRVIATIAQANFVLAIVPRQQYVVNFVCWLATRPSHRWPMRVRWTLGKYYHLGGLHVGGALAGTFWYVVFVGSLTVDWLRGVGNVSAANVLTSFVLVSVFVGMSVMAMPRFRATAHDRFEITHRCGALLSLVLVWINTVVLVSSNASDQSFASAMAHTPSVWLLSLTTLCAMWPWLLLRRVPITTERPSSHAVIVRMHHVVIPPIGTTRAISRRPFIGWHHFANVPAKKGDVGYRMVISRAGDWTGAFIDDPPKHVWVRGLPASGVANVKRLFTKVVYVVTGSGIGPALGHLLASDTPSRLVWITRNPRHTYGNALVNEVLRAQPDAIVWNTDELGKPDVLRLAYGVYRDSEAEAVICISNKRVTWQVVHGMERLGIPAFGPIWDS